MPILDISKELDPKLGQSDYKMYVLDNIFIIKHLCLKKKKPKNSNYISWELLFQVSESLST